MLIKLIRALIRLDRLIVKPDYNNFDDYFCYLPDADYDKLYELFKEQVCLERDSYPRGYYPETVLKSELDTAKARHASDEKDYEKRIEKLEETIREKNQTINRLYNALREERNEI